MNHNHYRSVSKGSTTSSKVNSSRTDFTEVFTSFPTDGIKDSQNDPNIISNIVDRFKSLKSAASNAVQQVLPTSSLESSLNPFSGSNDTLNSIATTARPSRISSNMSTGILPSPANVSRQPSRGSATRSLRSSSAASRNASQVNQSSTDLNNNSHDPPHKAKNSLEFSLQNHLSSHASNNNIYKPDESHDEITVTIPTTATRRLDSTAPSSNTTNNNNSSHLQPSNGHLVPKLYISNDTGDSKTSDPSKSVYMSKKDTHQYPYQSDSLATHRGPGILNYGAHHSGSLHTRFSLSTRDQDSGSAPNMSSNQESLYSASRDNFSGNTVDRDASSDTESIVSTARNYFISRVDRRPAPLKSGGLGKEFWMKDENATECFGCSTTFTTFRRKHHCRICGQIFCSSCTLRISGDKFNHKGKMRVCKNCTKVIEKLDSSDEEDGEEHFGDYSEPQLDIGEPLVQSDAQSQHYRIPQIEVSFTESPRHSHRHLPRSDRFSDSSDYNGELSTYSDEDNLVGIPSALTKIRKHESRSQSPSRSRNSFRRHRSGTSLSLDQGKSNIMRIGQRKKSFSLSQRPSGMKIPSLVSQVSIKPSMDLNTASINHAKAFIKQSLQDYGMNTNLDKWIRAIMSPLLECAANIDLDIKGGDNIDIRHYVKLKRIPGGSPSHSKYIDGIVFSQSLSFKSMPQTILNPRILLANALFENPRLHVTKLFEIARQESSRFDTIIQRVAQLQPHIILSTGYVSRTIVKRLDQMGVAVVSNVKTSVINRIARYTQATISTYETLSSTTRLGSCSKFEVRTFRYQNVAKKYLFFSGTPKQLGCTIVLRGADMNVLATVKAVVEFMVYVVFNLKLETSLLQDQYAFLPSSPTQGLISSITIGSPSKKTNSDNSKDPQANNYLHELVKYQTDSILSASPFVQFGYPYLLRIARGSEDKLVAMDQDKEIEVLKTQLRDMLHALGVESKLKMLPEDHDSIHKMAEFLYHQRYQRLYEMWSKEKRQWEMSHSLSPYMFTPSTHQHIVLLFSIVCTETATPCVGPELLAIDFYTVSDVTLGQFIENICMTANTGCSDDCGKPIKKHSKNYVHGNGCISVTVSDLPCTLPGMQDSILMWSTCKICNNSTPILPMSDATWKYSLGKYFELSFWSTKLTARDDICPHNLFRDHIRYFGWHNMVVRVEYEAIELYEVSVPTAQLTWDPEREMKLKVQCYSQILEKINNFFDSVSTRLTSVKIDGLIIEKIEACQTRIDELLKRSDDEKTMLVNELNDLYISTQPTSHLPLNGALRSVQEYVVNWDLEFTDFENSFFPSEKDITRITAQHLKKIFEKSDDIDEKRVQSPIIDPDSAKLSLEMSEKESLDGNVQITPECRELGLNITIPEAEPCEKQDVQKCESQNEKELDPSVQQPDLNVISLPSDTSKEISVSDQKAPAPDNSNGVTIGQSHDERKQREQHPLLKEDKEDKSSHNEASSPPSEPSAKEPLVGSPSIYKDKEHKPPTVSTETQNESPDSSSVTQDLSKVVPNSKCENSDQALAGKNIVSFQNSPDLSVNTERFSPVSSRPPTRPSSPKRDSTSRVQEVVSRVEALMEAQRGRKHERKSSHLSDISVPDSIPESSSRDEVREPVKEMLRSKSPIKTRVGAIPILKPQSLDRKLSLSSSPDKTTSLDNKFSSMRSRIPQMKQPEDNVAGPSSSYSFRRKYGDTISIPAPSLPSPGFRQRLGTRELEHHLMFGRFGTNNQKVSVSSLANHFEQLSRDFEKERARERRMLAQTRFRAFPVASSKPIVEVYETVKDAVQEESQSESDTSEDESPENATLNPPSDTGKTPTEPETPSDLKAEVELAMADSVQESTANKAEDMPLDKDSPEIADSTEQETDLDISQKDGETTATKDNEFEDPLLSRTESIISQPSVSLPAKDTSSFQQTERQSLLQSLASFWADRSATGWQPLDYPLTPSEHIFVDSDVIVREDEPSSLIAFSLSSPDYLEKLRHMRSFDPQTSEVEIDVEPNFELERHMLKKTGIHLKYQFQEGSAKLSCKIFYAEQFDALRRQCNCDSAYIQSLSRCVKWDSSGGKSGSAFLKTLDDRLVVKQLSPAELDAFLKFAPSYFEFMAQAFFHELPSVLSKIFGFYQIQIRNPITNKTMKMDVLVMENLFYNRKTSRIFDLKGSMRNRHVQQTGRENEVLLDENMVEYIYESPLFVREHSKKLLRSSLWNDTLFLAKMNVMDYSLVIAIDSERHELVVGIIDFIRTFTWDKKLESWVKERGLVGGGVKEPTVVSPRQYKFRFREAMERYVMMVPDCWYQEETH